MHDLIIRDGLVVDGTGAPGYQADVAVDDGCITDVGKLEGASATRILNAEGRLVTPGFVDIHTHFDGQVTWDPLLTPSCWHGVTTVVMGNCGVGFAPAKPDRHDWLIQLMEGVEDIPGTALAEGIRWNWESFPEYLDYVASLPIALDIGAQLPHGTIRSYVMGERGADNEPASTDEIRQMADLVREGMEAGALGFSSSRNIFLKAIDGRPIPGTFAAEDELMGIAQVLGEVGYGTFEVAPAGVRGDDLAAPEREIGWMARVSKATGRPITFGLVEAPLDPDGWKKTLRLTEEAVARGANLIPQVHGRAPGGLWGLQTYHVFQRTPIFRKDLGKLSLDEQLTRLRSADVRSTVLAQMQEMHAPFFWDPERTFVMGDPPEYEPAPETSIAAIARREGRTEFETFYDLMLQNKGRQLFNAPLMNYVHNNLDSAAAMLEHPLSVVGLGDAGAHCGFICDASIPSFMLTFWARDRHRGKRFPVEWVVKKHTADTAALYGLNDRGVIKPGMKADFNVINYDDLRLEAPVLVHDLPAEGARLIQRSRGISYTIVSGQVVMQDGEDTGTRPGKLVRGPQIA